MATPIIPWLGGKRRLADTIIQRFPPHTCYIEVFAGGAALYFLRQPAEVEVINDINGDVVNLYRVVKSHLEEFVRQFKWALGFSCFVDLRPYPLRAAKSGQLLALCHRHPQGERYRFLSLLHRLAALTPSWASSFVFLAHAWRFIMRLVAARSGPVT